MDAVPATNVTNNAILDVYAYSDNLDVQQRHQRQRAIGQIRDCLLTLNGSNTYTGVTTITGGGALQAKSGTGLPAGSLLRLNGGVLQGNGTQAVTFTRTLSNTAGSNRFYWGANGGGFSANNKAMTVKVNNGTSTLTWGTTQGSQIVGPLMFGSTTAANTTTFQNGINLNGAARTIQVIDNPDSTADIAILSGVISGSGGSLAKTGDGMLKMTGSSRKHLYRHNHHRRMASSSWRKPAASPFPATSPSLPPMTN